MVYFKTVFKNNLKIARKLKKNMKFNIPQDFNIKKLLSNLDSLFKPSEYKISYLSKTSSLLCKAP
jgi:hypothetical protein